MSTNADIGIEMPSGEVESIFVKWDGDYKHVGSILLRFFSDRGVTGRLVGNRRSIGTLCEYVRKNIDPSFNCYMKCPSAGVSRAKESETHKSRDDFFAKSSEYAYLQTLDGAWIASRHRNEVLPLKDVVK